MPHDTDERKVLSYQSPHPQRVLTWRDYGNASAQGIGVMFLGLIATGCFGHLFEDPFPPITDFLFVASLWLLPALLGFWQFRRAVQRFKRG